MEKYGEFITNGLDLLSFLLVTPEILTVIGPTISWAFALIITLAVTLSIVALLLVLAPYALYVLLSDWFGWQQSWAFGALAALLIGISTLVASLRPLFYGIGYKIGYQFG